MSNYAMVSNDLVIDVVLNVSEPPIWPTEASGYIVEAIECDSSVTIGMKYDKDTNTFYEEIPDETTPEPEPEPEITQLDRIEEKLNMLSEGTVSKEYMDYYIAVNTAILGGE